MAKRVPYVPQLEVADCGAACLAMLCRYHGREVPLVHVRALVNTSSGRRSRLAADDFSGRASKPRSSAPVKRRHSLRFRHEAE